MSIANLFAPNDYDLYCKSITTSSSSALLTNDIDTIGIGDQLDIGATRAGSLFIGRAAVNTTIQGNANVLNLLANDLSARTSVPMTLGANSAGLTVTTAGTNNIGVDQQAPVGTITVGGTNANDITLGNPTIASIKVPTALQFTGFAGGTGLARFEEGTHDATGSGCILNTANFVRLHYVRINNNVIVYWRFLGVPTAVSAASPLILLEAIPAPYRPSVPVTSACAVVRSAAAGPPLYAGVVPGIVTISAAGGVSFSYCSGANAGTANFAIADGNISISNGSAMFTAA